MTAPEANRAQRVWGGAATRLDRALLEAGLARSRGQASELIANERVRVDGDVARKAGARVAAGSTIEVSETDPYVSRAAHKLVAALDAFGVSVSGLLVLDLGASTGGFTQVLLERGAREVIALDVGHDQLVSSLRDDARVRVVEGCNARELTPESLRAASGVDSAPELVVADLSFISLTLVLPAIARVAAAHAPLILLVKPQFEVGRQGVRDGIVTGPALAERALAEVLGCAAECGYGTQGLIRSPIAGTAGNQEFVVHFTPTASPDPTEWEGWIRALVAGGPPTAVDGPREQTEAREP